MKRLWIILFCFLLAVPAHADIAYEPPFSSFFEEHRSQCTTVERNYYSNGQKGYITLRQAPDGLKTRYITNGVKLHIYCTYGSWAMISHENGVELTTPAWTELSELYLIYDGISFQEEYEHLFGNYSGTLTLPEGKQGFYVYEYPGAPDPYEYTYLEDNPDYGFKSSFTDNEGRLWAYISYYRGLRNKWVCIDDPCTVINTLGIGDPNLALIEAQNPPAQEEPLPDAPPLPEDPDTEVMEAETPIIPAKKPPLIVLNALPVLAVVLVATAVVVAILLIVVCYRRKKKEE